LEDVVVEQCWQAKCSEREANMVIVHAQVEYTFRDDHDTYRKTVLNIFVWFVLFSFLKMHQKVSQVFCVTITNWLGSARNLLFAFRGHNGTSLWNCLILGNNFISFCYYKVNGNLKLKTNWKMPTRGNILRCSYRLKVYLRILRPSRKLTSH